MEIGKRITVEITDTNENGNGIARYEGAVVFVPGLLPGEKANVVLRVQEKNYFIADCVSRISDSVDRITEVCRSAEDCGGCTLGFMSYDAENRIKRNTVRSALRRAGLPYDVVRETVSSDNRTGYRNKISVHYDPASAKFGYRREKSLEVIDFECCLLCPDIINRTISWTNANSELISPLEPESLQLRTSSDGVTVSLYTRKSLKPVFEEYKNRLMNEFDEIREVLIFTPNGKKTNKSYIKDRIYGINMSFTSEAFRQVNTPAFEKLLDIVHGFASEREFNCGADLYCGSGIIGLTLAKRFSDASFLGIEINADAVKDAERNAAENGINNIRFFAGDAPTFGKRIPKNEKTQLIVVDPPRAGLSKEMRSDLLRLSPERIIYVSCNPQTMARDTAELCGAGYHLREVVPVNMFPLTKHCECVVYLCK